MKNNLDNNFNKNFNNNNNGNLINNNGNLINNNGNLININQNNITYIIVYFLIVYFSFQALSQLFNNKDNNLNTYRLSSDYLIGFISSCVLLFLLIFVRKEIIEINIDKSSIPYIAGSLIISLLYCFTKTSIDNLTLRERENMIKNPKKYTIM